MNTQKLVSAIVQNVLKELQAGNAAPADHAALPQAGDLGHTAIAQTNGYAHSKFVQAGVSGHSTLPQFIILAPQTEALFAKISAALNGGSATHPNYSATQGSAQNITFWQDTYTNFTPATTRYVLPYLGCSAMAALAMGQGLCPYTKAALKLLLSGKNVEVMEFEYLQYSTTAPAPLFKLYKEYKKQLASFGLTSFKAQVAELKLQTTLLVEKDVHSAHKNGFTKIILPPRAIISPLAKDTAKDLNISLICYGNV